MRLLVCEYVTGGGLCGQDVPQGLWREGDSMRRALVKDLRSLGRHDVTVLHEPRVVKPDSGAVSVPVEEPGELWRVLPERLEQADAFWPIAPETDGLLARMTGMAREADRPVVGSSTQAVALAGSKRATARCLAAAGLTVVPTRSLAEPRPAGKSGWVVKPDDGAGAEDTRQFDDPGALEAWIAGRDDRGELVVQPFVEGSPVSLSMLCQRGSAWLLACNYQSVTLEGGELRYHGGVVGALEHRRASFAPIAQRVAEAIPGLWGYVGVDLIDSDAGPVVLEVNPRLTTSYIALGKALGFNPAGLVLELLERKLADMARPLNIGVMTFRVGNDG